jgi:hypothetical protein
MNIDLILKVAAVVLIGTGIVLRFIARSLPDDDKNTQAAG